MHVLIATDGQLAAEPAADLAARLAGPEGQVTILTVVEVPRRLLGDLRAAFGDITPEAISVDHETVDVRERVRTEHSGWPGDDAVIERYLSDQGQDRTAGLVKALRDKGYEPAIDLREGEQPAADVLRAVDQLGVDVLCIGSHGKGLFEGLLGSVGTKLIRLSPCPVLLIRKRA